MSLSLRKFSTFLILTLIIILFSNNIIEISAQSNKNVDCPLDNPCAKVNKLLEPCKDTLPMPSKLNETDEIEHIKYYVGNTDEAKCWCNKEFYNLLLNCTICLTSPSVNATIEPLDEYKNDCNKYGIEFKETSQSESSSKGPNKFLLALGISALVTLLASVSFCLFAIREKKKKSLAYEKLKTDYHSKGRGIEISRINENDEKGELYSPTPIPPPLAHQPQIEQNQQSKDQSPQDSLSFNTGIYGPQQHYVDASQSQVPASRGSYEYIDNINIVSTNSNNGLSQPYVYQHYPA